VASTLSRTRGSWLGLAVNLDRLKILAQEGRSRKQLEVLRPEPEVGLLAKVEFAIFQSVTRGKAGRFLSRPRFCQFKAK
jgi:hypothetical protein